MKVRTIVSYLSGPSHQLMRDGEICDEYVATVWFKHGMSLELRGKTEAEVERKMARFLIGECVEINEEKLNGKSKKI